MMVAIELRGWVEYLMYWLLQVILYSCISIHRLTMIIESLLSRQPPPMILIYQQSNPEYITAV